MFVVSGGMYVTKEDVRYDQKLQAQQQRVNAEKPTPPPNAGIDYSAIRTKFHFAWRLFQYRYIGDPLRSMFANIHSDDDDDELEDEFNDKIDKIHETKPINNIHIE